MRLAIGNDHGGYKLKVECVKYLIQKGYEVIDVGSFDETSCDYPVFAKAVGESVVKGDCEFGVLICKTGEGISISANKIKGIRCAIGYNDEVTELARKHNNANVIAFGASFTSNEEACKRIELFIKTPFDGDRHQRRVNLISDLEK